MATSKPEVLIINDNGTESASLAAGLRAEGFAVSCATNAIEALGLLGTHRVDAVLVDLMLPNAQAFSVARHVRTAYPHAAVILLSDYLLSPAQLHRVHADFSSVLSPTGGVEEIARRIRGHMHRQTDTGPTVPVPAHIDVVPVRFSC